MLVPLAFATPDRVDVGLRAAAGLFGLAVLLGVVLGALLMAALRTRREQSVGRGHNVRGRLAEDEAELLLTAAGYQIVARQQRTSYMLRGDESEQRVGLSFDFVVEKAGVRWVAEVKTGALGTQLKHADTRRQLLEYQLASGHEAVLLVDPERGRITRVSFPFAQRAAVVEGEPVSIGARVGPWIVCVALGFALCLYFVAR